MKHRSLDFVKLLYSLTHISCSDRLWVSTRPAPSTTIQRSGRGWWGPPFPSKLLSINRFWERGSHCLELNIYRGTHQVTQMAQGNLGGSQNKTAMDSQDRCMGRVEYRGNRQVGRESRQYAKGTHVKLKIKYISAILKRKEKQRSHIMFPIPPAVHEASSESVYLFNNLCSKTSPSPP